MIHFGLPWGPSLYLNFPNHHKTSSLGLEGEAGADLVGGLVKLLGIEGRTNAELDALTEENVVSNGSDTTVVDLGLF